MLVSASPLWGGINEPMENYMFPGVYREDTATDFIMKPYPAKIFEDKPQGVPVEDIVVEGVTVEGTPFGYSLVNYLANERGHQLFTLDDFDEYNQGIEIVNNKMRVYLPLSSFNNLVTVWISTELADAVVYQPVPAKGVITAIDWLGSGEISDKDIAKVTVKQEGKDGGRITVTASGNKTSFFTFEDDLVIHSNAAVDDSRVNPGDTITFTGIIYYEGTSTVPEDITGITVKVELAGVLKGSDASPMGGSFSISVAAESSVAQRSYNIYAITDENSIQNQTVNVIVDALKVDDYSIDLADVKVYVHMKYAYDGSPVDGGEL